MLFVLEKPKKDCKPPKPAPEVKGRDKRALPRCYFHPVTGRIYWMVLKPIACRLRYFLSVADSFCSRKTNRPFDQTPSLARVLCSFGGIPTICQVPQSHLAGSFGSAGSLRGSCLMFCDGDVCLYGLVAGVLLLNLADDRLMGWSNEKSFQCGVCVFELKSSFKPLLTNTETNRTVRLCWASSMVLVRGRGFKKLF